MPRAPRVEVFSSNRRAGALYRSEIEEGTILFGYLEGSRPEEAVSLTMPVVTDQYDSMGTVHPIFEMNLPEGALLERLRLMFAKAVPGFDDLTLLSIVGQSQIGRLRYAVPGAEPAEIPVQSLEEILTYSGAEDLFDDLLTRYAVYSGVSGIQPKILLSAAERRPDRVMTRGATHIVKSFDPRERPELAANEYYCMRAARHAGIPTANVTLSKNRRILVVERFDLKPDGSYFGLEDFCVLNGLRSHGRYEGSYELVAKRIGQFVSPTRRREALHQLFMIVALSCALENGDAHLKNFAVMYEHPEAEVYLASAYDLVCTTAYIPRDVLALTLKGAKSFPDRKTLEAFGRTACLLRPADIHDALSCVTKGIGRALGELRSAARRERGFAKAGEHLIRTFERGLARLDLKPAKTRAGSRTASGP